MSYVEKDDVKGISIRYENPYEYEANSASM